jgi:hypothetical protein
METLNYNDKIFVSSSNTENGEVDEETIFHYHQIDGYIWAEYYGGIIIRGFLVGYIDNNGILHFSYEHINNVKVIRTGKCESTPEIMGDGRIKLREKWEWTNGDKSKGESIVIERR